MSASNLRAVLAGDEDLGAGNVLLRLAEHGADMDMPRVTFDTAVDGIEAWTPLSLRTLTERVAARAEWFQRHGIGRRDPVAVYVTSAADVRTQLPRADLARGNPRADERQHAARDCR